MRIYCTSVAESKEKNEIKKKIQECFPNYKVVVIPNRYATKEGRKNVREYSKSYYEKNKEVILEKKRERDAKKRAEKLKQKEKDKLDKKVKQKQKKYER